ncbi:hypothetical protein E4656_01205 [Natronospirillum operosum]|uniref:Uncharacterized protein n=1 Tax=Natronospirillum operosum TaxID=2759953 RepID=A0A4Z0WH37_9GAMM|nr:hypothetical protein [Natronospirillum operosum]TGG95076.1 hypothetical protein E4656_01205 [Natronospirillum operosum]
MYSSRLRAARPTFSRSSLSSLLFAVLLFLLNACSSTPKEVVELSWVMGQDLRALQQSYDGMVVDRFDNYRAQRLAYLEEEWVPLFLEDWIDAGQLVPTARGDVVWSGGSEGFAAPTPGQEEQQLLATVLLWSEVAVENIEDKRRELIEPLDVRERQVRAEVQEAFGRLLAANAHITAHLNAQREVEAVQQDLARRLQVDEELDQINALLVETSDWAQRGLDEIRAAGL